MVCGQVANCADRTLSSLRTDILQLSRYWMTLSPTLLNNYVQQNTTIKCRCGTSEENGKVWLSRSIRWRIYSNDNGRFGRALCLQPALREVLFDVTISAKNGAVMLAYGSYGLWI
jgi:hypothetical protein